MSNFPDLSSQGYQVVRKLGHNSAGGRVTYLAVTLKTRQPVVIKQFQFANIGASWSDYDGYQREIQVLRGLDHPGIPRYLASFQTKDGFCMVQEYKHAPSLAVPRSFDADQIKKIAVSLLEILVYLQNRIPPVIHRDIKPENILVDDNINVYLVDFGLAKIGEGEVAMSSVAKGTLGFMPPEQLFNQHLSEASDLYGLGTTLICLLTNTKSTAISQLIDEDYRVNFKHLVPKLSLRWIEWLEKIVELKPKDRYPNAAAALEALKPIYVMRVPEVNLSQPILEVEAKRLGERLTQTITITNSIPDTVLSGQWEVTPHQSDPPHNPDEHSWIAFSPAKFESNQSDCKIVINTSRLMAGKTYEREVLLRSNSLQESQPLTIKVKTARVPVETRKLPYISLALLLLVAAIAAWFETTAWSNIVSNLGAIGLVMGVFVTLFIAGFGVLAALMAGAMSQWVAKILPKYGINLKGINIATMLLVAAIVATFVAWFGTQFRAMDAAIASGFAVVDVVLFIAAFEAEGVAESCSQRGFSTSLAVGISLLTTALGISLGLWFKLGLLNPLLISTVLATGVPLAAMIFYPPLERKRLIANYRKLEQHLIKP